MRTTPCLHAATSSASVLVFRPLDVLGQASGDRIGHIGSQLGVASAGIVSVSTGTKTVGLKLTAMKLVRDAAAMRRLSPRKPWLSVTRRSA